MLCKQLAKIQTHLKLKTVTAFPEQSFFRHLTIRQIFKPVKLKSYAVKSKRNAEVKLYGQTLVSVHKLSV
jgi:hypothetical protein